MPTFSMESFGHAVGRMSVDVSRNAQGQIALDMAEAGAKIARAAARSDLTGDTRFSGWPDRDLGDLQVKPLRGGQGGAILAPTRKSGGPWKVAEQGRNQGGALGRGGGAIFHGPGINRKTGVTSRTKSGGLRKTRAFKAKRWNGYTTGFGTASDAQRVMERRLPKIADKGARKVIQRHFDVT